MKLLIFHTGSLGDTLVALPALWVLREHYKGAHLTMLSDKLEIKGFVPPVETLRGSGLIDEFMYYPAHKSFSRGLKLAALNIRIRLRRFDALIYLVRNRSSEEGVRKDLAFFRLAGIKNFIGHKGVCIFPKNKKAGLPLPVMPNQADQLLQRLSLSGLSVPQAGQGKMDLKISDAERKEVERWISGHSLNRGRPLIAIGPGSNKSFKIWPADRYREVVHRLLDRNDVWPIVFGGPEDRHLGMELVKSWGRGSVAAGELNVRQGVALLQHCELYLGNDTGTMHMAAVANIPCVSIFSSWDYPGIWHPYGNNHIVLRAHVDCEGCRLFACPGNNECILAIRADDVFEAAEAKLKERLAERTLEDFPKGGDPSY